MTTNEVQLQLQGDWTIAARFEPATPAQARLEARLDPAGSLNLSLTAGPETPWTVEMSSDLQTWSRGQLLVTDAEGHAHTTIEMEPANRRWFRVTQP